MKKRVLILSNHFITIYNFRKELIQCLIDEGHEVTLSIPYSQDNQYFIDLGCKIVETKVNRRGLNPIEDLKLLVNYIRIMKEVKPDIIFSYTIKPNIYGSIASNFLKYRQVNNITGTGATFLNNNLISKMAKILYKLSVKYSYKVFFQNRGDLDYFIENKMVKNNYDLLPGSGVNLEQYEFSDFPDKDCTNFIFIGRIMELKGIDEYLEAAKFIKKTNNNINFYVAGFIEEKKYESIIKDFEDKGIINYIGFQRDIQVWIKNCHCTVLPSHGGEGVPNVLLESAAIGRICIASNISGSCDIVDSEDVGYLFEVKSTNDLITQMEKVIKLSDSDIKKMGILARKKVEMYFNRDIIIQKYIEEVNS
ncbi:glycosyltransferase family 4 protein [Turicibacter sanguinis]|uniref:glycosyltransferase family 4 protein n=1 Tax=Turicibacter sanguinis TaxID=154288 RepID=UPI0029421195|nr:glycosyltransferase family 4 protein [Turicibacter sanguinis]